MMEIPRGRVYMMRKEIEHLRQRLDDNYKQSRSLVNSVRSLYNRNVELTQMLRKVEEVR